MIDLVVLSLLLIGFLIWCFCTPEDPNFGGLRVRTREEQQELRESKQRESLSTKNETDSTRKTIRSPYNYPQLRINVRKRR